MAGQSLNCEKQSDQPEWRTVAEVLFCLVIVLSYLPQYRKIRHYSSVEAISTGYILSHVLFSISALVIQTANVVYFGTFKCIGTGELHGSGALAALGGLDMVLTQFICSIGLQLEQTPIRPGHLKMIVWVWVISLLPLSLLFPSRDGSNWAHATGSRLAVYGVAWGFFTATLAVHCTMLLPFYQCYCQLRLLQRAKSRRALSISSMGLLAICTLVLGILLMDRAGRSLDLAATQNSDPIGLFLGWYFQLSLPLGYLVTSAGYFILLAICWKYDRRDILGMKFGWIRLEADEPSVDC
ncbi:hypothetical protein GQ53DRAFT_802323 [Thozetella sp. PMI_491]|nr:hypothetical protein GQ53DRAFT_802323 [Thozetella sp. PMI_491]